MASKKKPFNYFEKRDEKRNINKAKKNVKRNRDARPPRQRDWLDYVDVEDVDIDTFERVMPRDEGDRRKAVESFIGQAPVGSNGNGADITTSLQGQVTEVSSGLCRVWLDGEIILCSLRGSLTANQTGYSNVVAVGDTVAITQLEDGKGIVDAVLPRRNQIARPDPSAPILQQVIVANIDQLLIVSAWRNPHIWTELIDRYLITAERDEITPIICVNKLDLAEDRAEIEAELEPYQRLGYTIVMTSAENGDGLDTLREMLYGKISAVAGLSGVGKSSLLSAAQPGFELRTGEVNEELGQGRHTTTQATMLPFGDDGFVIDTAGIRGFDLTGVTKRDLAAYYPEMLAFSHHCHFHDCMHLTEPECAVRAGVEFGSISQQRYHNYQVILESLRE